MKSAPFSRSLSIVRAAMVLIAAGVSRTTALIQSGADQYTSRGHGKSKPSKRIRRSRGKSYPFSSTKQHTKSRESSYMKIVNGFEIMQTRARYHASFE